MNKKLVLLDIFFLSILILFSVIWTSNETEADESLLKLNQKWTGDFDGMLERNVIRALVPYSKTFYFLDKAVQRGATYDALKVFEKHLNKAIKNKALDVQVIVIPTKRDRLLPALIEGVGDIAAGNLTITAERQNIVDFSDPTHTSVDEIIVTGPASPPVKILDDLSGKEIHVRASSSYYESLNHLNDQFKKDGKKQMKLVLADDYLEDEDLLEMMNAGLIPMIVIDSHKGKFWKQIFNDLTFHSDIKLRTGGRIAWAIRKNSHKLKKVINDFIKIHKVGTLTGNILVKRYLQNTQWVRNPLNTEDRKRFEEAIEFFKRYSKQYDFDWLMVAALAYQESRIDQGMRSQAGAIGVMQLLQGTAKDKNVNIPNIEDLEPNIHAGVKYLRFIRNRYFEKEPMDDMNKMLFTFASYNAGPAKINRRRTEARQAGLDPNVWFRNVEIATAKKIGLEPVRYVSNIYKYYIAYRLSVDRYYKKEAVRKGYKK